MNFTSFILAINPIFFYQSPIEDPQFFIRILVEFFNVYLEIIDLKFIVLFYIHFFKFLFDFIDLKSYQFTNFVIIFAFILIL